MKAKDEKQRVKEEGEDPHHRLFEAFGLIKNADEAKRFLLDLCTPAELQALADRWLVVDPIKEGKSYRKIYDETGVSVTTIGRVARYISQGSDGYNLIYKRLKKKKNVRKTKTQNRNPKKGEVK